MTQFKIQIINLLLLTKCNLILIQIKTIKKIYKIKIMIITQHLVINKHNNFQEIHHSNNNSHKIIYTIQILQIKMIKLLLLNLKVFIPLIKVIIQQKIIF